MARASARAKTGEGEQENNEQNCAKEVFIMPRAYVLINVKSQHRVRETLTALSNKKGVISADAIFGPYDLIAVIEGQNLDDLSNTVINDLYDLGHIENSTTCIAIE